MISATADTMSVSILPSVKDPDFQDVLTQIENYKPTDAARFDLEAMIFETLAAKAHKKAQEIRHG